MLILSCSELISILSEFVFVLLESLSDILFLLLFADSVPLKIIISSTLWLVTSLLSPIEDGDFEFSEKEDYFRDEYSKSPSSIEDSSSDVTNHNVEEMMIFSGTESGNNSKNSISERDFQ